MSWWLIVSIRDFVRGIIKYVAVRVSKVNIEGGSEEFSEDGSNMEKMSRVIRAQIYSFGDFEGL